MTAPSDIRTALPASTPEHIARAIDVAVAAWTAALGPRLQSVVLFGSVARGEATADSDIDVIAVVEALPRSLRDRRAILLDVWSHARERTPALRPVEWNLIVKTPDEARARSPLYLDIVEDGILLVDREHFFAQVLDGMRARMRELGSRRIFLADGSWYWDLKPDFRFGEVVEI